MPTNRPTDDAARRRASFAAALCALGPCLSGCGSAPPPPAAAPAAPEPKVMFVEEDAPFIVDWEPGQIASLTSALQGHNIGALVVASRNGALRLLPECWVSGVYAATPIGMYRGMLQVRHRDSRGLKAGVRADALQQLATSENVPPGTLLDFRVVVAGRRDVSRTRRSARFWELSERAPGACRGATHFIRAALTGAFERSSDPGAPGFVQGGAAGQKMASHGGDFTTCLTSGDAKAAACGAFLKIELTPILPARVELRLVSFALGGQSVPQVQFVFRGKNDYRAGTTPFTVASAVANWLLPVAEITEDAPMIVEAIVDSKDGPQVLASGQISPMDLRKAVFDIDLRNPKTSVKVGTMQLAASEPAASP
jgi:hypothetical protein